MKDRNVDLRGVCDKWAQQSNPWRASGKARSNRSRRTEEASRLTVTLAPGVPRDAPWLRLLGATDPYGRGPLLLQASALKASDLQVLAGRPEVSSIEPDCPLPGGALAPFKTSSRSCAAQSQWNARAIGLDKLSPAPARTWVVVMDSGVHCRHPDLQAAMVMPDGSPFPPEPDTGVPCPPAPGSDFICSDDMPNECSSGWACAHGTSMAGIIGARGLLVAGVNSNVGLRSVRMVRGDGKVFDRTKTLSDLAEAVRVANALGADVINMSWTVLHAAVPLHDAIVEVGSPGAAGPRRSLAVAASGGGYPANFHGIANLLSVGGARVKSNLSIVSSTFNWASTDHFVAPGYAQTTVPPDGDGCAEGTSIATAYVAGAASRVMADPRLASCTPAQIKEILLCTAEVKPLANLDQVNVNFLSLAFLEQENLRSQACANGRSWPSCVP
jgi:hypothetical protein